jgi:hypothetical protein
MGFNFTSFAGGFASAFSEDLEKEEKLAQTRAVNSVKNMAETYKTMQTENRKLKSSIVENINALRAYDPTATEEELFEIAKSKPLMELITSKVKSGDFTSDTMKLSNFAKVQASNNKATALELVDEIFKIPAAVEKDEQVKTERTGNLVRDIIATAGDKAGERMARQTAEGLGVSLEQLQAAQQYKTPTLESKAVANIEAFKKEKTFDQQYDDAKLRLAVATKSGDKKAADIAKADMLVFKSVTDQLSDPQKEFASKVADIKNRYMFGTPKERAAAKPEYDKLLADIRAEAAAKKVGESKEEKVPALGTLNTFTSAAVARKVAEVHGDLLRSKQLAIIEKPDGSASLEYTGDNPELRAKINATAFNAAKNALSLYMTPKGEPMTRDVAAVLNTYIPQSIMKTDKSEPPPAPATPSALLTPKSNIASLRRDAEAAISKGADRAAVAKRFKDQTGQEL